MGPLGLYQFINGAAMVELISRGEFLNLKQAYTSFCSWKKQYKVEWPVFRRADGEHLLFIFGLGVAACDLCKLTQGVHNHRSDPTMSTKPLANTSG